MRKVTEEIARRISYLRERGYSIPEISAEVPVSKTTVLRYASKVKILPKYLKDWAGKRGGSKKKKLLKEDRAFKSGLNLVGDLTFKEKMLFLCALYWAEGNKKDFELINSSPELIKIFVEGLRELLKLPNDRIKSSIRIYDSLDKNVCLRFWSELLGIPKEDFGRMDVLPGNKKGKLKYGMCRIRILRGGDELKRIVGINKAMTKKFCPCSSAG